MSTIYDDDENNNNNNKLGEENGISKPGKQHTTLGHY